MKVEEEKKEMSGGSEGQPKEDEVCEDCLSKEFIREQLSALWVQYGERYTMKSAIADVAFVLGVPLQLAKRNANG